MSISTVCGTSMAWRKDKSIAWKGNRTRQLSRAGCLSHETGAVTRHRMALSMSRQDRVMVRNADGHSRGIKVAAAEGYRQLRTVGRLEISTEQKETGESTVWLRVWFCKEAYLRQSPLIGHGEIMHNLICQPQFEAGSMFGSLAPWHSNAYEWAAPICQILFASLGMHLKRFLCLYKQIDQEQPTSDAFPGIQISNFHLPGPADLVFDKGTGAEKTTN